jgi:hypothetical protein
MSPSVPTQRTANWPHAMLRTIFKWQNVLEISHTPMILGTVRYE